MSLQSRAVVGTGGIDAASLGFGRQTKHPARHQSPLPVEQHCAPVACWRTCQRAAGRPSACGGRRVSAPRASGLPSLYKRDAPPNLF
ncbi:hypothetical protein FFI87_016715 [Burkholderia sp. KBS0801]|nr:hypothetical protein FFI87_016715 [Burkholderia sp. KBS0801]